jgi:hypothetical protein
MIERLENEPGSEPDDEDGDDTPLGDSSEHSDVSSDPDAPAPDEYEGSERLDDDPE